LSFIFDGLFRNGEALAVIVRFVANDFKIRQLLVKFHVTKQNVDAEQLMSFLADLVEELNLRRKNVKALSFDIASVNQAA